MRVGVFVGQYGIALRQPDAVSACYCTFCQRRTGGALSIHAFFDEQNIELIGDGLTTYEHHSDKAVSGCGYTPATGAQQL